MKHSILFKAAVLASGVIGLFTLAAAQSYSFSKDLSVGATGADVTALQTWLIANGFHIPSIESGDAAKGRFGSQTRDAVRMYQKSVGLSASGFFGPLTRASVNKGQSGTVAVTTSLVAASTTVSTQVPALTTIGTPGIIGNLTLSLWPSPSDATPVSKGQTVDVAGYKIQTSASDMALKSISLDVNNRLWLYAGTIAIKDDLGNVVAQVSNLGPANFTEITTGTDYRLTIPVANYVLAHNVNRILIVSITALPSSDRASGSVSFTQFQTRAVDGTGVTDTQTLSSSRSFSYQGSGGTIVITVDPKSPPNMLATISTGAPTQNIPLGVVDFKSQGTDGTMQKMSLFLNTNVDTTRNVTTIIRNVKIQSGTSVFPADSITYTTAGSVVAFNNLNIKLPKDTPVPVAILVDVNTDTNGSLDGVSASTTLLASGATGSGSNNPLIVDSSYTSIAIPFTPLLSSDITFSQSDANLYSAAPKATLGTAVQRNNTTTGYNMSFSFAVTAGNNTLYISADPNIALSTTSSGLPSNASASLPLAGVTATPGTVSGDTNISSASGYYVIPAGTTRSFTYNGSIDNTGGTTGLKTFSITGIKYGTTTSALSTSTVVYYNYAALKVGAAF